MKFEGLGFKRKPVRASGSDSPKKWKLARLSGRIQVLHFSIPKV